MKQPTSVELLCSRIRQRRSIRLRFSIRQKHKHCCATLWYALENVIKSKGRNICNSDESKKYIEDIASWLIDPHEKPSLMIMGQCGNGKTTMMHAVSDLISSAKDLQLLDNISDDITIVPVTARSITQMAREGNACLQRYMEASILMIDDLGTEAVEVQQYGNYFSPVIDLLTYRYDHALPTIITTNLDVDDIRENYGERIAERMKETYKLIVFTDKSHR